MSKMERSVKSSESQTFEKWKIVCLIIDSNETNEVEWINIFTQRISRAILKGWYIHEEENIKPKASNALTSSTLFEISTIK